MKNFILILLSAVLLLAACQNNQSNREDGENPVKIKVLIWDKQTFFNQYETLFLSNHPDIDLEVVSLKDFKDPILNIETILKDEEPDVAVLDMAQYRMLSDEGKLTPLSVFIEKDEFDLSKLSPAIIDYLKDEEGELYGLSPTFEATALYYNKGLFEKYGIPLPQDEISWEEIFRLARRFPQSMDDNGSSPLYGLSGNELSSPLLTALRIGESAGLSFYSKKKFILNTEPWIRTFQQVIDCQQASGCIYKEDSDRADDKGGYYLRQFPFLRGSSAMAIETNKLMEILDREEFQHLDWGVTIPLQAGRQKIGNGVKMKEIFAIPAASGRKEEAWAFIKYINGEDYAKLLKRTSKDLPVRVPVEDSMDSNMAIFYRLDQIINTNLDLLRKLPEPLIYKIDGLFERSFADVFTGSLTVAEALERFERELQLEHDAIMDEENGKTAN